MSEQLAEQIGILTTRVNHQDKVIAKLLNAATSQNEILKKCKSGLSTHFLHCCKVEDALNVEIDAVGKSEQKDTASS